MVGDNVMAVLSSHKAVKEIIDMQGNASGNRPKTTIGDTVTGGVHMAQAQAGELYPELRHSSLNVSHQTILDG